MQAEQATKQPKQKSAFCGFSDYNFQSSEGKEAPKPRRYGRTIFQAETKLNRFKGKNIIKK